jgi:hypothetical protein
MLTSRPGWGSSFKMPIAFMGGDPYGYHVETVTKVPKGGAGRAIEGVHSTPAEGGAAGYLEKLDPKKDYIVKRFKDPAVRQQYLKNLLKLEESENVLESMLGPYARSKMYDMEAALKGGSKSFLPQFLQKLIGTSEPLSGQTVCSSLPGIASPVCLAPGVPRHEVMPHHIQRSPVLETPGHYRAGRTGLQRVYEHVLRAAPWLLRGGIGAGLGYGAYRGVKALMD